MMDTSEYMPMFLAEAREHLQELNLAIVRLEQDSSDQDTVQEIFRVAHSFKGMAATMGFASIAELTHTMEDVFELLRQRTDGLSSEAITTVLACLDALETAVDRIESNGAEELDAAPLIARLQDLIRERTPDQQAAVKGGETRPAEATLEAVWAAGGHVLHMVVELGEETQMPAVRAHMVIAALWEHGEVIGSIPAPELEDNFAGHTVEGWLVSDADQSLIVKSVSRVSDVANVELEELLAPDEDSGDGGEDPAGETAVPTVTVDPKLGQAPADLNASTSTSTEKTNQAGTAARSPATHASAHTVRVDAERLDALMQLMGELVIHRTAIEALTHNTDSPELSSAVQNLTRTSQSLQSMVMQVRMIPVDVVLMRFPRLVRDLQEKLGKELELELIGRETELDRSVVDAIGDPLVHLVRNSLDHGLEEPEVREAAGKSRTGKLTITARHAGGSVVIEVADDGRGVDPAQVARKALQRGLIDSETAANLDMRGAIELLFAAGFSTSEVTSDLSGRGVGLDVVRSTVRALGGDILMESVTGKGTSSQIRLPLTLAIVSALEVDISGTPFAIPIDHVERTLTLADQIVRRIAGRRVLSLEDGVLPLYEGSQIFGLPQSDEHGLIVIIRNEDHRIGLTVDEAIGQRELVTRPVPQRVSEGQPISGGAVLANGEIALIIDCDAIVHFGARNSVVSRAAERHVEMPAGELMPVAS